MSDRGLMKLAGAAAVAGGILRIANCFPFLDEKTLAFVYFFEDVLLLAGLMGIYFSRRESVWSFIGFALGVLGLLTIRSASLFGAGGYQIGAAELLIGLCVIGIPMLRAGQRAVPSLFMLSFVLGLASLVPSLAKIGALAAAIAFGLGFALAGLPLLIMADGRPADR